MDNTESLNVVERLTRDLAKGSSTLGRDEARFLVDAYYQMQHSRITHSAQIRSVMAGEDDAPHSVLQWLHDQSHTLEKQIARSLTKYVESLEIGKWLLSLYGIGGVIGAGLIAHTDIRKANGASSLHRYAGLVNEPWEKGCIRPWNAQFKTLCVFKLGESFVKTSGYRKDYYGHRWKAKKEQIAEQNENLVFLEAAAEGAERVGKTTEAYKYYSVGKLPPAHVHARARRWTVKLFLSHFYEVYCLLEGITPRVPYVIEHLGHKAYLIPPNLDVVGLQGKSVGESLM